MRIRRLANFVFASLRKYMMSKRLLIPVLLCALASHTRLAHVDTSQANLSESSAWQTVKRDYQNFYTCDRFTHLGVAFGIGAVTATT